MLSAIVLLLGFVLPFPSSFGACAPASRSQYVLEDAPSQREQEDQGLGAVASENSICSQIGIDLLKQGGNAADALVGTTLCVGVTAMYHSGIGGGGFMLVRAPDGSYESIDFRETAPAAAFRDMYHGNINGSVFGGLASGVPGELRGLEYLHNNYGVLPWHTVVEPAVKVARDGFVVAEDLIHYMDAFEPEFLTDDPAWAIDFAPNGTRVGLGDTLTRKRLAKTLEIIAEEGADAFYVGPIANATIAALEASNGTMTLEDLANYAIILREPISIDYRGNYTLTSCGAPASGQTLLAALKIFAGYANADENDLDLNLHRLIEATRFAYGKRSSLGDPSFVDGIGDFERDMLSDEGTATMRSRIKDSTTLNVSDYDPDGFEILENHGTSHIVTTDASGLSISLTTTVNLLFGSRLIVPETGIIMNNEMNDFSLPNVTNEFNYRPSPANYIAPYKRPLSSVTPLIATHPNGTLYLVIGAAGGSRIITATLQTAWNLLERANGTNASAADEMSVESVLQQARWHDQLLPNDVFVERGFDEKLIGTLRERGHVVQTVEPGWSAVQAIRSFNCGPHTRWEAAGEPRQRSSAGLTA